MKRCDYEELAREAVTGFLDSKVPLEQGIVKIAKREELNPEQIKRVVEMANTRTFLDLFKKTAGDDRMVEFEIADPDKTLEAFYEGPVEVEPVMGAASESKAHDRNPDSFFDDVADENSASEPDPPNQDDGATKVASWKPRVAAKNLEYTAVRTARILDSLRDKVAGACYACDEYASSIANEHRGIYSREKLAQWEQDSLAAFGADAVHCINAVRQRLGKPAYTSMPDPALVKQAAAYHVYEATDALRAAGFFLTSRKTGLIAQEGLRNLQEKVC